LLARPDKQISLTDPDWPARWQRAGAAQAWSPTNVTSAVDTTNHLIVAHEVTNVGTGQIATGDDGAGGESRAAQR